MNRDDVTLHQQYMADLAGSIKNEITKADPTPYFQKYGPNYWAVFKGYLDEITDKAAAPVIAKYTGRLAAVDVYTASTRSGLWNRCAGTSAWPRRFIRKITICRGSLGLGGIDRLVSCLSSCCRIVLGLGILFFLVGIDDDGELESREILLAPNSEQCD